MQPARIRVHTLGPLLRQIFVVDNKAEIFVVGTTERCSSVAWEYRAHLKIPSLWETLLQPPRVLNASATSDQPARLLLSEFQNDEGRYLIGGIFLASQHRHLQHVEQGVAATMQTGVEQWTLDSVDRRNSRQTGPLSAGMVFRN